MDTSSLLSLLSVIISALITAIGAVLAAYVSKDRVKKERSNQNQNEIWKPKNYVAPSSGIKRFLNIKSIALFVFSLIVVAIFTRWLLGRYLFTSPANETIEFASKNDPVTLNPQLEWNAGSSELSAYAIDGDRFIMVAGPYTWPNFPMISYLQPFTGDFSAQVKVVFVPEAEVIPTAQMVGILVHPTNGHLVQSDASFPQDWVAVSKSVTDSGVLVGCRGAWDDYSSDTVFLKIERKADVWRCAYSSNGENWIWLKAKVDNTQLQNKRLTISLFAYAITDKAITAVFSDWMFSEK